MSMGAMLDMMQRMMGNSSPVRGKGQQPGQQEGSGESGGEGQTGDSDTANGENGGEADGARKERRTLPKAAGRAGSGLPPEFQKALDAYNKSR